jgi:hypothetical protein
MYSFGLLETGCYYLVKEKADSPISLIKATVESDHCLFVICYDDPMTTEWRKKTDPLHDIIECLEDGTVREWEKHYNSSQDAYYEEDDD